MSKELLALAGKDIRLLLRDKGGAFVTFVFPLIYCVFFGLIFAVRTDSTREMQIIVVDEDRSEASAGFADLLDAAAEFTVKRTQRAAAVDAVRRGKVVAYVVLTDGFGEAMGHVLLNEQPRIEVGVDPARTAEAAMIQGLLTKYSFESIMGDLGGGDGLRRQIRAATEKLQTDTDTPPMVRLALGVFLPELERFVTDVEKASENSATADGSSAGQVGTMGAWQPIDIAMVDVFRKRTGPKNSFNISFPQGIIWGVLGCCASFGTSMVIERTSGTLSRLRVAPIGRTTILGGKALACFGSTVSLSAVLFLVGWLFFGVVPKSIAHLAVSLVAMATAFVGIMMFLSILGKTERSVSGLGWAVLLGMAMLGGGMVPQMFMPAWMQSLSHVSPVRWAILAMEGAVWRDFSTSEMLLPWAVLFSVGVAFFTVGAKGFSWQSKG